MVNGLFSSVDSELFTGFLNLFYTSNVEDALLRLPSVSIHSHFSTSGPIDDEEFERLWAESTEEKKEATIGIILGYFGPFWQPLRYSREELTQREADEWDTYSQDHKRRIITRIRTARLENLLSEIESEKSVEICKGDDRKEAKREIFRELVQRLINEVTRNADHS